MQNQDKKQIEDQNSNNLSKNKVDVEIEPDVKSNYVNIQICSCSLRCFFQCFEQKSKKRKN